MPRVGRTPTRAIELDDLLSSVHDQLELRRTIPMDDADDALLACTLDQPDGYFVRRHALAVHGDRGRVEVVP